MASKRAAPGGGSDEADVPAPKRAAAQVKAEPSQESAVEQPVLVKARGKVKAETGSSAAIASGSSAQAASAAAGTLVNPNRVRPLNTLAVKPGPVIYWMSRDQRMADNWALLHAAEQAASSGASVAVAFNLVPAFLGAGARQFGFVLRGLRELQPRLAKANIPFFMLRGDPAITLPQLAVDSKAGLLVTDYSPLRLGRQWREAVANNLQKSGIAVREVDAHNVVPVWVASDKRETAARTIRPKIHKHLPEFLKEYPQMPGVPLWTGPPPPGIDWDSLISEVLTRGADIPEVSWCKPGEEAALAALSGPTGFLSSPRLGLYDTKRNDPGIPSAISGLSPYLHYGHLSPQRAALEAAKLRSKHKSAVESYLEELVVRRELADNFCHYTPDYDSLTCAAQWAKDSLELHRADKREVVYTREQLEAGRTHDELWNACQLEMVHLGKMHGFMRMYWAKKILEWTEGPEDAIAYGIYLNDRYELDGREPAGYVGVMWSMAGIHDMGWAERPVFGKIRYMNYAGCKRKFNIAGYCAYIDRRIKEVKAEGRLAVLPPVPMAPPPPAPVAAKARARKAR